jgi:hypothetical protein
MDDQAVSQSLAEDHGELRRDRQIAHASLPETGVPTLESRQRRGFQFSQLVQQLFGVRRLLDEHPV